MVPLQSKQVTSDQTSWSSEQWIGICNIVLLILVAFFCGMVLYEIQSFDQKFISVLDSSRIAIDFMSVDLIDSHSQPVWSDINDELKVYSAFYKQDLNNVLIIGSSDHSAIQSEDIRCLVQYEDGEMSLVDVDQRKEPECSILFTYCFLEREILPVKVALVSVENTIPKQWMNVENNLLLVKRKPLQEVAACVQIQNENFSPLYLKSVIVLNEMAGVQQFYIYYRNVSREILDMFLKLTSEGHFVHMLSWNKEENTFPSDKCSNVLNEFVQDCSHRSLGKHNFLNILHFGDESRHLKKTLRTILVKNVTDIANY